ncbi:MAG: alpha/beta hydrolase [Polaromonas sp.]|nr:alpha/beta hydrolase [Polaromonas sp.]
MTSALTPERLDELLDPGIAPAVRQMVAAAAKAPPSHTQTPEQVRAAWDAAKKPLVRAAHKLQISDSTLDTPVPLEVRFYRPEAAGKTLLPAVVYFHGGGFTNGDLDSQDAMCCAMAEQAACVVMSVNYRKLPKHRFPAAFDDAVAAVRWLAVRAEELQVDARLIGTGGDSSGANLALAAAMALRGEITLKAMWLAYPIVGTDFDTGSYLANAHAPLLTRERCKTILRDYLGKDVSEADWRAAPLLAEDFSGLPSAVVIAAELDPLRSDAEILVEKMQAAGGAAVRVDAKGMTHAFLRWADAPGAARRYVEESLESMRKLLQA